MADCVDLHYSLTVVASRVRSFLILWLREVVFIQEFTDYMNGFRCNVTGSTSKVALATPQLPRRCGADPTNGKPEAAPGNCTYGAKQPFYWLQQERNNVNVAPYSPLFSR